MRRSSAALGHKDHENTTSNLVPIAQPFSIANAQQAVDRTPKTSLYESLERVKNFLSLSMLSRIPRKDSLGYIPITIRNPGSVDGDIIELHHGVESMAEHSRRLSCEQ